MIANPNSAKPLAAVDIGSNTIRLILANREAGLAAKKVYQRLPRLSQGLKPGQPFNPEALRRAHKDLAALARLARAAGAEQVLAGATMAARLAADGPGLMACLELEYGWRTMILSGLEEAALTVRGVLAGLEPQPSEGLIFDIGGRSTELSLLQSGQLAHSVSLDLGVVSLTEDFISHDPPRPEELAALGGHVRGVLARGLEAVKAGQPALIGTAGTVTTAAALILGLTAYQPLLVNGARLARADIESSLQLLAAETFQERLRRPGLPPARADVIVAGMVVIASMLALTNNDSILVSDNGLLEGLWLKNAEDF